jgi:hypothetical protein
MPPPADGKRKLTAEEEEEDEFGFESDEAEEEDKMPTSHEIVLKDHNKVRPGLRFICGADCVGRLSHRCGSIRSSNSNWITRLRYQDMGFRRHGQ